MRNVIFSQSVTSASVLVQHLVLFCIVGIDHLIQCFLVMATIIAIAGTTTKALDTPIYGNY